MFWSDYLKDNGVLAPGSGYELIQGITRQMSVYSPLQEQTEKTFAYKWEKRETYESEAMKKMHYDWLFEGYFGGNEKEKEAATFPMCRFLDAGCGSGFGALILFGEKLNASCYLGVDISTAVDVAKQRFDEYGVKGEFMQADILSLPFTTPCFDVIFSSGVLHHTDSTELAIKRLASLLVQNGKFLFYVYRKKAPIREWTDDHVREWIKELNDDEAWKALEPLTKLGKALGELNVELDVPEDIPFLGVSKGKINLQRFFYWNIIKAYYRPEFSLDEMNHINFDWFRPLNCHRQTPEQVEQWCIEAGLDIERMHSEEAGIYVVARKM